MVLVPVVAAPSVSSRPTRRSRAGVGAGWTGFFDPRSISSWRPPSPEWHADPDPDRAAGRPVACCLRPLPDPLGGAGLVQEAPPDAGPAVYRPRRPHHSPLYRILEQHFEGMRSAL